MKKTSSLIIIGTILVFILTACSASSDTDRSDTTKLTSKVPLDTLMVGTPEMNGDFISGFGNSAYDLSIKTLTGGYIGTYALTPEGDIVLNETVVKNIEVVSDELENKTYTFTLHEDLFWNNGDQITAKDFVASIMWYTSPEWQEAGASTSGYDALIGYDKYYTGESDTFAGVQLVSDFIFSITVSKDKFPYFWESVNAMVGPIHFDTYLPSCKIVSNEDGSYLSFSEGNLLENCNRIATTERYKPTVTCGPYSFVSYENQTVTLERNDYFKGDVYGDKPTLKYIVQKVIPQETRVEWVINGEVDLVEGIVEGEQIEAAKTSDTASYQSYLRAGYGYLAMMCDVGVTADANVRWALASLIDRNAVVNYVLGGYGSTVDAEYGMGQWMYQEKAAELQDSLRPISFNIATANDYLDKTEWKYEKDGITPFDRTKATSDGSYLRHNAKLEPMIVNHLGTANNVVTDIIEIQYAANASLAGVDFNLTKSDFSAVLQSYYHAYSIPENERVYNTFNLAANFTPVFDRYYSWHSDFVGTQQNREQLSDPIMDELVVAMRETDPSDREGFLNTWLQYQVRWNELMPQVPLYSNEFFDVYHNYVDNLNTSAFASYDEIICQISKSVK